MLPSSSAATEMQKLKHHRFILETTSSIECRDWIDVSYLPARLIHSLVISIFLYAWETWTLIAELERKIQATEMRYFRRLLGISYRDHVTNEEVRNRIRQAIGPYEDLLTTVKKRKLRWHGLITRSTGLAKVILQGTVQGGRRKGRQKKRWEDNITEWTGFKVGEALRKAENKEGWRTVLARSSLVPQRSTRLGDA